jgi:hypothetical protein
MYIYRPNLQLMFRGDLVVIKQSYSDMNSHNDIIDQAKVVIK